MNQKTSTALSFLFHPLILPCVIIGILTEIDPVLSLLLPVKMKFMMVGMVFITTILIPLILIFLTFRLNLIGSIYMKTREERILPLLIIAFSYYLTYALLKRLQLPSIFYMYMLGATATIIILIILNFFRKISLHMAGMGGFTGLMAGLAFHYTFNTSWLLVAGILLSGVLGTARLKLNAHLPSDLYIGWLAGAVLMFFTGFLL
ncbi:MAG TPA: hypothetical protein PLD52_06470 [Bacteroidales bacterium]|nr:hypothetical protein [Bacteroidales bacterium]